LAALDIDFLVDAADIVETTMGDPQADVERLARSKAEAVAARHAGAAVLAADTIVHDGTRGYGKPRDEDEARRMLAALCGQEHKVFTGIAVAGPDGMASAVSVSSVFLHALSSAEIADYVHIAGHMDKAGSYAIQDAANPIVERFEGCYCSIMGLPLWAAYRVLGQAGCKVTKPTSNIARCLLCPERTADRMENRNG
jgi:nucleoside triphosphate pyrophosphatase